MEAVQSDLLVDDETETEIDQAVTEGFLPDDWEPTPEDKQRVERYLRAVRYYRAERKRVDLAADVERERIEAWRLKHYNRAVNALNYLEYMLKLFSEKQGRLRRESPNGVLKWAKGRERVEIADEDAFCRQCDERFVRITSTPARDAIMAAVKNGEPIPEGADIVRGEDTFKVETE